MKKTNGLPRRDVLLIGISLAGITLVAWAYLFWMARNMSVSGGMSAMHHQEWNANYFALMFLMWSIMMVGMMLPSAIPNILLYASIGRKASKQGTPIAPTGAFVSGYIAIWTLFSLFATSAQWGLERLSLLSPMMISKSSWLGGALLISAGVYQFLPIKDSCLSHCRSPFDFISRNWRSGLDGAFRMGLLHGTYCLGCCWVLMLLLFVGGVMNLLWIFLISAFVLLEKVMPLGAVGGRIAGIIMIIAGLTFFWM